MQSTMFNPKHIKTKIRQSHWWELAANTVDNHCSNTSGIMITHHLQAVYDNVDAIFNQLPVGFYGKMFELLPQLQLNKAEVRDELKIVALLHDLGKPKYKVLFKGKLFGHRISGMFSREIFFKIFVKNPGDVGYAIQ